MSINCAPLVADVFCFVMREIFMLYLSDNNQAHVIDALALPQES